MIPNANATRYEITNRTPYRLTDTTLLYGAGRVVVGEIEPGGTADGSFGPNLGAPGGSGGNLSGALVRALDRELRSMLPPTPMYSPYVAASVEGYRMNISLDGDPVGQSSRLLLASPVKLAPVAAGMESSADFGRVDVLTLDDGSFAQGAPGTVILQDFQEAVFAYRSPAGLAARDISEGRVTVRYRGGNHDVERYDWDTARWIPVPGNTRRLEQTVPQSTFSDTGEAFFRMRTNGHGYAEITTFDVIPELR